MRSQAQRFRSVQEYLHFYFGQLPLRAVNYLYYSGFSMWSQERTDKEASAL